MKIEIEIDLEALNAAVIKHIAEQYSWQVRDKTDKIFESLNWSKMTPHVQEAILKMAADKLLRNR